jgi:hypothetical protein
VFPPLAERRHHSAYTFRNGWVVAPPPFCSPWPLSVPPSAGSVGSLIHRWATPMDFARKFGLLASACVLLDEAVVEQNDTRRTALALRARALIERANA